MTYRPVMFGGPTHEVLRTCLTFVGLLTAVVLLDKLFGTSIDRGDLEMHHGRIIFRLCWLDPRRMKAEPWTALGKGSILGLPVSAARAALLRVPLSSVSHKLLYVQTRVSTAECCFMEFRSRLDAKSAGINVKDYLRIET
jgi:hypothetical protein